MRTPNKRFTSLLAVSALSVSMLFAAQAVRADPVPIPAAHLQFTAPAGWVAAEARGPQFAMFNRGTAVNVEIMIPALDATHTVASLEAEYMRLVRPRWSGRPALRVVRESRGSMRRGQGIRGDHRQTLVFVTAQIGDRYLMVGISLDAGSTPADEAAAQQLIDSAQPIP